MDKLDKLDKYETHEKEFQAELTAYTVCSHFGIDTSDYSLKYLHDWSQNKTLKDKKQLLKEVRETTVAYIEILEETLINEREVESKDQQIMQIQLYIFINLTMNLKNVF